MLNQNKNFGFGKATGDWILNLDGDERVTPELAEEMSSHLRGVHSATSEERLPVGYEIPRKNIIFGKWIQHGLWWPDYQLRLFRRGRGKFPCQHVHEKIKVQGKTGKLASPLLHHNYQTVSQFIQKMDRIYTEDEVKCLGQRGQKVAWYDAIRMPVNDFFSIFFSHRGYRDGLHGLVLAMLQSFYALVVFAKTWEAEGFPAVSTERFFSRIPAEFQDLKKKFNYWWLTSQAEEASNFAQKICYQIKRRVNR